MPELPDVEGHRRLAAAHVAGRTVTGVRVADPALLEGTSPAGLGRSLTGRTLAEPRRHGKWLMLETTDDPGPALVFHFRMTGRLAFDEGDPADAGHDDAEVLALHVDHGALTYRTRRRLGGVSYLRAGTPTERVTGPLGPDALEVDRATLASVLDGGRGGLKSALMDQRRIAGLGNELVDEILWRTGLHPRVHAGAVTHEQLRSLHRELRVVLTSSVRAGHVPSGPTWLNGQRADQEPTCPRCGAGLRRGTVASRTTVWCPREQAEAA